MKIFVNLLLIPASGSFVGMNEVRSIILLFLNAAVILLAGKTFGSVIHD